MDFKPTYNRILGIPVKTADRSEGGIIIPERSRRTLNEMCVTDIGPAVSTCKPGDNIYFQENTEWLFEDAEGQQFALITEDCCLMVQHNDKKKTARLTK